MLTLIQSTSRNTSPQMNVFKLISSKNWRKLKVHIFINKDAVSVYRGTCTQTCNSTHNALQYACYYHPPLDVIKCLYHADPKAIRGKECKGKYALHIACEQACSPAVIRYLLKKYPKAADQVDEDGRSPFLLTCMRFLLKSNKSSKAATRELLEVLQILSASAPISLIGEDCNGMSALDFLLEEEVDIFIIKFVQMMSMCIRQEMDLKIETKITNKSEFKSNYWQNFMKAQPLYYCV